MANKVNLSQVKNKKQLIELQRYFAKMIRRPLKNNRFMAPAPYVSKMIQSNKKSTDHERLEFYAQQYWWRIIDSFDQDFPTVKKLLTDKKYQKLKLAYLSAFPSISFTLRNLGSRFTNYIKRYQGLGIRNSKLLYEAACLDWEIIEAFDAEELPALTQKQISSPDFSRQKLTIQPHLRLLALSYPVDTLVRPERRESTEASNTLINKGNKSKNSLIPIIKPKQTYLAIHRFNYKPHIKQISKAEYLILKTIEKGCSLKDLQKRCPIVLKIDQTELQNLFAVWMSLKWLTIIQPTRR